MQDEAQPIPWTPEGYQLRGVDFLLTHGGAGLLLDPGLGKTSITLAAFSVLLREGIAQHMLVVCPLRPAQLTWPAEVRKWKDFGHLKLCVLHGKDKEKLLAQGKHDVYVVNPEGLKWLLEKMPHVFKRFFQVLCIDESSKFKNTQSVRFKLLKPYLGCFKKRWILTGSPTPKSLLDLFGQIYILDLGRALGRFITHYRARWFHETGYGGYTWMPNDGAAEEIAQAVGHLTLRMSEKEYLKLPPLRVPPPIYVDMPPKARRAYDNMEVNLFASIRKGDVTAANAAVASMKCRQIANGGLYLDEGGARGRRKWEDLHDEKALAVQDLIEELSGKPVLVAFDFEHDLARLVRVLGKQSPVLGRGTMQEDARIEAAWNAGDLPYLLGNPASIAHGLNLQGGQAVAWHSLTWNYEHWDQFNRRVYRKGQRRSVTIYRIAARDTLDDLMMEVIGMRGANQSQFFALLKRYAQQARR